MQRLRLLPTPVLLGLATLVVMVPAFAALGVALAGEQWYPAGDMAQAELHMRGFFAHPPLVGAAGRIVSDTGVQGSHPGPSLWVALLPVYVLGGRSSGALMAAVVSVHLAAVAASLGLAWRRGGRLLVWAVGVALILLMRSAGPDFIIEPWNPWLAVLPFAVFVLLVAEVVQPTSQSWLDRRHYIFAGAILVGSHCIQCHAGYVVIVAAGLLLALGAIVCSPVPGARLSGFGRALGGGAVAGFIIWLPPILDQLRRRPGNLEILWQHFGSPSEPAMPLSQAIREIATQVNVLGPWLTGPGSGSPSLTWARYLGCAALIALWAWSWMVSRRRQWFDLNVMLTVSASLIVVGALAISRIFGPFFEYTIRWMWVLVILSMVGCLVVAARVLGAHIDHRYRKNLQVVGGLMTLAVIVASSLQLANRLNLPGPTDSKITGALHSQLKEVLDPSHRYLIRFYDPYTLNATGFGLTLALERSGFDVGVDPVFAAAALPHRTRVSSDSDEILWVVVGPAISRAAKDANLRQVALFDPRTPTEQANGNGLLESIAIGLRNANREDLLPSLETPGASLLFAEPPLPVDIAELVRQLILLGQPVGVFSINPGLQPALLE